MFVSYLTLRVHTSKRPSMHLKGEGKVHGYQYSLAPNFLHYFFDSCSKYSFISFNSIIQLILIINELINQETNKLIN